jgi:hypothetical protein
VLNHGRRRRSTGAAQLFSVLLTLLLVGISGFSATPARAQNGAGNNDVTFWDDAGNPGDDADIQTPETAAGYGWVYLNPNGGRTTDDGLLVIIGSGRYHVVRDRDWQIYKADMYQSSMGWLLFADGMCFNLYFCTTPPSSLTEFADHTSMYWDSTTTLLQNGPTTWKARMVNTADHNGRTYTLTVDTTYTPPSRYVQHRASLTINPDYDGEVHLYLVGDMYLDGSDNGPGYVGGFNGDAFAAQINDTSALGVASDGTGYTSLIEAYYQCPYTEAPSDCGIFTSSDPIAYPDVDADPNAWFGPGAGRPYPMDPPIVNGAEAGTLPETIDAGVGMHWDLTTARTINAAFWLGTREEFDTVTKTELPEPLLTEDGFPAEEVEVVTPPAECQLDPDMAITPEAISLAAGGRTTVTVTLRNLCNDRPLSGNDLLLSLSDGLRIVGGSNGLVNLGQRGAFQGFTLSGGETRSFVFEVEAASALTVAPLHVAELYRVGRVARRIDGVFVAAAVTTPAPAVVAPAPAPAPAEPAPAATLPATLPNTAGEESILLLVALLGLGAVGFGYRSLTRR